MIAQLDQMSQPDPKAQEMAQQNQQMQMALMQAQIGELQAKANMNNAQAELNSVKAMLEPEAVKAEQMAAMTKNLPSDAEIAQQQFDNRVKVADLMLKEEEKNSNERITQMQMQVKKEESERNAKYVEDVKKSVEA